MKPDDPVSRGAEGAIAHLNEDHADALLEMARALGGQPEATAARCLDADRSGLDLVVTTDGGEVPVRVSYEEPIDEPADLRKATVKLAHRARLGAAD
jgi:putative heme iron utilization protein